MEKQETARLAPRRSVLNDPRVRGWIYQILVVFLVVWFGWEVIGNTAANLRARNITGGFGFLDVHAGFGITQSLIDYSEVSSYGRALLVGLLNTLTVAAIGIVLATLLGIAVGIARLSRNWLISRIAAIYVEIVRNLPLLLQLFFWYFAVLRAVPGPRDSLELPGDIFLNNRGLFMPRPVLGDGAELIGWAALAGIAVWIGLHTWSRRRQAATGRRFPAMSAGLVVALLLPVLAYFVAGRPVTLDLPALQGFNFVGGTRVIPEFVGLVLALTVYTAAFIAEIVRAGILAVSHGQSEAARALGLREGQALRLVVVPQALRVIVPPLTSQYLNLAKNSSLAVAIAYPDLVSVGGTVLNQTGQAVEVIAIWMVVYLSISLVTSLFMNWYNSRIALVER